MPDEKDTGKHAKPATGDSEQEKLDRILRRAEKGDYVGKHRKDGASGNGQQH